MITGFKKGDYIVNKDNMVGYIESGYLAPDTEVWNVLTVNGYIKLTTEQIYFEWSLCDENGKRI